MKIIGVDTLGGYIDSIGLESSFIYKNTFNFSEGYAVVQLQNGKYSLIIKSFEIVAKGSFEQYNTWYDITWKTIIFIRNKILFKLTYTCPAHEFTGQANTINSILNSLHFLEKN